MMIVRHATIIILPHSGNNSREKTFAKGSYSPKLILAIYHTENSMHAVVSVRTVS